MYQNHSIHNSSSTNIDVWHRKLGLYQELKLKTIQAFQNIGQHLIIGTPGFVSNEFFNFLPSTNETAAIFYKHIHSKLLQDNSNQLISKSY